MTASVPVTMFRNAAIDIDVTSNELLRIEMKDDPSKSYVFKKGDSVYSNLQGLTWEDVKKRFDGGSFFFVNNSLFDYRTSEYKGYVASDEAINILNTEIGVSDKRKLEVKNVINPVKSDKYTLRGAVSRGELEVQGMSDGGHFKTAIAFSWNPFYTDIHSDAFLERLICSNGMVATSNAMQYRIPIINDWKENLEVATRRLQQKFKGMVVESLEDLTRHRASVGTIQLLNNHLKQRYHVAANNPAEKDRLKQLLNLTNASEHCADVYKMKVFQNQSIAKMLPSHLTAYDAFNIATEMASHTREISGSSDIAINRVAAGILFDGSEKKSQASFVTLPKLSEFSDPDEAFLAVHEAF